ncbi:sulfite exporter TauE/SafE family protein [Providencia vermicola]|uniref:sulfite exporter TauE/SafE family protein n=1 Tax=Providencia vermicola TaxID=333965 RepID=UPI001CECA8D7|nr:sulfite exporter TauE/SafE family protein [Providencia vermicola]
MDMLLIFLLIGCVTGFLAGLLGIGGGAIIVPIIIYTVTEQGMPHELTMKIALATSFSVIIFSTASSAYSHSKHKAILWNEFPYLSMGTIMGVFIGAYFVHKTSDIILQIIFCLFMGYTIYTLLFSKKNEADQIKNVEDPVISKHWLSSGGVLIGFISSFIGIAGGAITLPLLSAWGFNTRKCIATSSMLGVILATMGAIAGVIYGWNKTEITDYYLGFIYLPAFIGIGITSVLFAPLGVKIAYKLSVKMIRQIFAIFLILVVSKMIHVIISPSIF